MMKTHNKYKLTHVSFKITTSEEKKKYLHVNELMNVQVKCEILKKIDIMQTIIKSKNNVPSIDAKTVRDEIINVQDANQKIFKAVKQGSRKFSDCVFAFCAPSMKSKVYKWKREECGSEKFRACNERDHETSVLDLTHEQIEYLNNMKEVKNVKFTPQEMKVNGHDKKMTKSWVNAVTQQRTIPG